MELETVPISSLARLNFEALSYTWGSQTNRSTILVTDGQNSGSLLVARNLDEALRYLRFESDDRVLWVDAICINQEDVDERNSQVGKMADIYSSATRVVAWLGPQADNSDLAMDTLEYVDQHVRSVWENGNVEPASDELIWSDLDQDINLTLVEIMSLTHLFQREWFSRLWIWQEIYHGTPKSILQCGRRSMLWSRFRNAFLPLHMKNWPVMQDQSNNTSRMKIAPICLISNKESFGVTVGRSRFAACTDPRDRIFALQSMLHPNDPIKHIQPDYRKSKIEVYKEVFLRYSRMTDTLVLLELSGLEQAISGGPSWLPDWSKTIGDQPPFTGFAATCARASMSPSTTFHLQVAGVHVSKLTTCARFDKRRTLGELFPPELKELQKVMRECSVNAESLAAFSSALVCGNFADGYHPPDLLRADREKSIAWMHQCLEDSLSATEYYSLDHRGYLSDLALMMNGRNVFGTDSGHFGLGPGGAQIGDLLVAILSCRTMFVLRPQPDDTFQVIGPASCEGFRYQEALLSPIPRGYRSVVVTGEGMEGPVYKKDDTEEIIVDDLRRGALCHPWDFIEHDNDHLFNAFVNLETGEQTLQDPRITVDALRARGVPIRDFVLV